MQSSRRRSGRRSDDRAGSRRLDRRRGSFGLFEQQAGDPLHFLAQLRNHLLILVAADLEPFPVEPAPLLGVPGLDLPLFPCGLLPR